MKYRKRPIVVEAFQWDAKGDTWPEWLAAAGRKRPSTVGSFNCMNGTATIHTLEGQMDVAPGDYIIQGVQGELYPCKPDVFEATYEVVVEGMDLEQVDQGGLITRDPGADTFSMSAGGRWINGRYVEFKAKVGFTLDELPAAGSLPSENPAIRAASKAAWDGLITDEMFDSPTQAPEPAQEPELADSADEASYRRAAIDKISDDKYNALVERGLLPPHSGSGS